VVGLDIIAVQGGCLGYSWWRRDAKVPYPLPSLPHQQGRGVTAL